MHYNVWVWEVHDDFLILLSFELCDKFPALFYFSYFVLIDVCQMNKQMDGQVIQISAKTVKWHLGEKSPENINKKPFDCFRLWGMRNGKVAVTLPYPRPTDDTKWRGRGTLIHHAVPCLRCWLVWGRDGRAACLEGFPAISESCLHIPPMGSLQASLIVQF